jgi:hypothetical protein
MLWFIIAKPPPYAAFTISLQRQSIASSANKESEQHMKAQNMTHVTTQIRAHFSSSLHFSCVPPPKWHYYNADAKAQPKWRGGGGEKYL